MDVQFRRLLGDLKEEEPTKADKQAIAATRKAYRKGKLVRFKP